MKTINRLLAAVIPGTVSLACYAQPMDSTTTTTTTTTYSTNDVTLQPIYHANEISVDAFGSASLDQHALAHISGDRIDHHTRAGWGLGMNYFFCRYIGVGADAYSQGEQNNFIYAASGNVFLRLPIYNTGLAPYIFGGGGYQFDDVRQGFGQAGGGLEYRFVQHVGVFLDARYVFDADTENYGLARAGVNVSF